MFLSLYHIGLHKSLLKGITTFNFSQCKYYLSNIKIKNSAERIAEGKIKMEDQEKSSSDVSNKFLRFKIKEKIETQKV